MYNRYLLNNFVKHISYNFEIQLFSSLALSSEEIIKLRTIKLAEYLNCTTKTSHLIIKSNKDLLTLDNEHFSRNAIFCNKHFKLSEVIEFPTVLSLNSNLLQHRYFALTELGFSNIPCSALLNFLKVLKKSVWAIQYEGIMVFDRESCIKNYMTLLSNSEEKYEIISQIKNMYDTNSNLSSIKKIMNSVFLASKLNCSLKDIEYIMKKYPPLGVQSIIIIDKLVDTLFNHCNISSKNYYLPALLTLHHEHLEVFLKSIPTILGVNSIEIIRRLPLILRRRIDLIQKIEEVLKEFNITGEQLLCCTRIMSFMPRTIHQRLTILNKSPEFSLLKSTKRFLWLVCCFNNLKHRLEAIKDRQMPYSLSLFLMSEQVFNKYVCYNISYKHLQELIVYLSDLFNCDRNDILLMLQQYPGYHKASLLDAAKIINFLLISGVTKKQLLNGIGIILYNPEIVEEYFGNLKNFLQVQSFTAWKNHYNLIQLLIYFIEQDSGFRGNRVYRSNIRLEEELESCRYFA